MTHRALGGEKPEKLNRRDFARLAATSLTLAACPPEAALLGAAASEPMLDERALRASAVFTMSL